MAYPTTQNFGEEVRQETYIIYDRVNTSNNAKLFSRGNNDVTRDITESKAEIETPEEQVTITSEMNPGIEKDAKFKNDQQNIETGAEPDDTKLKSIETDSDIIEEEKNCNLTHVLRDLLKHRVGFQYPSEETTDIIESVHTLVQLIVSKVTSKVDWLPVSRLVRVGSIEEGTSILKPNEFDYIVVIDHKGVQVERICRNRKGYAHVTVTDPKLKTLWRKWFHDGFLKGAFTCSIFDYIRHVSTQLEPGRLRSFVSGFLSQFLDGYFKTLGDAFMFEVDSAIREAPTEELTVMCSTGKLHANHGLRKHGPGFMPTFVWESKKRDEKLEISVDITPAIEIDIPDDFIHEDESFNKSFWDKLQKHGKIMLIPDQESEACKPGLCFRITFTEIEILLMKELRQHHKEVYMLLKYLFNGGDGYVFLPSYVLKTFVLKHDCYCCENANLASCFKRIVAACVHYLINRKTGEKIEWSRLARLITKGEKFQLHIPSIFIKGHNILSGKDFPFTCEVFLAEIDSMLESLDKVAKCKEPSFKDIKIVNSHKTGAEGYIKALTNTQLELNYCIKCLGKYFDERIV